jgi:hypothetical protein
MVSFSFWCVLQAPKEETNQTVFKKPLFFGDWTTETQQEPNFLFVNETSYSLRKRSPAL